MSWFNFFNKKTETTSENHSEEFISIGLEEKLGVCIHIGNGNYVLVLAPFWDENLMLDESTTKYKIVAVLVLNGLKEGNLPLEKLFEIHQVKADVPVYFTLLEKENKVFKKWKIKQLPEILHLGIGHFYYQKGTHFVQVKVDRTLYTPAYIAYIGINLQYKFLGPPEKYTLWTDDTWFIGNFDFINVEKGLEELYKIDPRGRVCYVQFRDWIKSNREIHLIAFSKMGWEGLFVGKNNE